jgi:Zn-dependent M28 family amino/carboxypeptidase
MEDPMPQPTAPRRFRPGHAALALAALLGAAATAAPADTVAPAEIPEAAQRAAEAIDAAALRGPIRYLSDDLLEGRGPSSRGDELARLYIAAALESAGMRPGGPGGSWQQPFDLVGITTAMPRDWTFERPAGGEPLAFRALRDYVAASGVQQPDAKIEDAEVVFVGYGIQAPEYGWDDFKDVDLSGKVLLMLNNDPDWDPELFAGPARLYYGRWSYKYESAARQGAAGAIIIHDRRSAGYPWQVVRTSWTGEQFELPAGDEPRIQVAAWLSLPSAQRLAKLSGYQLSDLLQAAKSPDFRPMPLGVRTSLTLDSTLTSSRTANVLGVLTGSDPILRNEAVVYTAHHDHLGKKSLRKADRAKGLDAIYNGALDNASGVAQVLAIARAYSELPTPPKRSILFLLVAAEEQGLLGSKYYAAHPTFAPGRIAADLNFDRANMWGRTQDVSVIGWGKSSLDGIAAAVAAFQERKVVPDTAPEQGYYYRSDQFSFAQIGVPALYAKGGTDLVGHPKRSGERAVAGWIATHYHQTSDELTPQWNFDGMVEDAQLGFYVGLQVADAPALPTWNPGDEFEAARRRAIEALTAPRTPAPQAGAAPSAGDGTGESTDEPAVPAEPPSAPEPPSGRE